MAHFVIIVQLKIKISANVVFVSSNLKRFAGELDIGKLIIQGNISNCSPKKFNTYILS